MEPRADERRRDPHSWSPKPPARVSLQQVAQLAVERRPGRGVRALLRRSRGARRAGGSVGLPARDRRVQPHGPGHRACRRPSITGLRGRGSSCVRARGRGRRRRRAHRSLQLLPDRGAHASARARPRSGPAPDHHRRHDLRRRAAQQLRAAVDRRDGRAASRRRRKRRPRHRHQRDDHQAGGRSLVDGTARGWLPVRRRVRGGRRGRRTPSCRRGGRKRCSRSSPTP